MKPRLRVAAGRLQSMLLPHFSLDASICLFVCAHVCACAFSPLLQPKGRNEKKWAYGDGCGDGDGSDDDDDALAEEQCFLAVAPPPSSPLLPSSPCLLTDSLR